MYSFLYARSPVPIQELMLALRAQARKMIRENGTFVKLSAQIEPQFSWSREELENFQSRRLANIVRHAESNVPYYSRLASHDTFAVSTFANRFPILTKKVVANAATDFMATNFSALLKVSGSTSGTTGTPLRLVQTLSAVRRENAFIWRQLHWAGYRKGQRRVWLRGDMVAAATQKRAPFWRRNVAEDMLMMSSYHLSETTAKAYLDALQQYDPVLIQAYPSAIGFLANWMWNRGMKISIPALKGIVTSSETLTPDQRQRINETFGVTVFDWYGSFERVAAIGTCSEGEYHVMEDYGFTELISLDDGTAEIISTGFNNELMPLIRYRTGDTVELVSEGGRCICGSNFRRVKQIFGRMDDAIKTPDGRVIGRLDHIFKGLDGIAEAQIVQSKIDVIELRIVLAGNGSGHQAIDAKLKHNLRERVGGDVDINVNFVSSIPRTKNGKLRAVVCTV